MNTEDGRWSAQQVETLIIKVLHGQDHRGWSTCEADKDHEESPWYTERAAALREVLVSHGLLQPPSGVNQTEYGHIPPGDPRNSMVSLGYNPNSFTLRYATHSRPVVSWPWDGPNDDWPRYQGPWVRLSTGDSNG